MLSTIQPEDIIFIDIETVPTFPDWESLPDSWKEHWNRKATFLVKDEQKPEDIYERAGIYAEFGKIICISAGVVHMNEGVRHIRIKSFSGDNEKQLLEEFAQMLIKQKREVNLCAHNGKEFDFPYICRRMLINGIALPQILDVASKKPWEVKFLDTMELWKFGDYKHYTSLNLLTHIFNIPSPKTDIDGSQVATVYYKDKNLARIVEYCERDVIAIIQILLRFKSADMIPEENITVVHG